MDAITRVLFASDARKTRSAADVSRPLSETEAAPDSAFDCSILIPFSSTKNVVETLMAVARHTPPETSYECILTTNLAAADTECLREIAQGDIRLVYCDASGVSSLCNTAAKAARGRYLCILPEGVVPQPGWLEAMTRALDQHEKAGVVGGRIIYPSGLIAHAGIAFDANFSALRLYHLLPGDFSGACKTRGMRAVADCFLVRRACWESTGGMDERFESCLYDVDFCLQAGNAGWEIVYEPESLFLTTAQKPERSEGDRLWFYGKWMGHVWPDEERYWKEDGVTQERLLELYAGIVRPEPSDPQVAAP
jgi:hypothetical protein